MIRLTDEQQRVVESSGDAKVEALAGTGKTTTLVHYANHHRASGDILYLVFNRAMRDSAENKFPRNVKVTTAHSLAWWALGLNGREVNRAFDAQDVMRELKLRNDRTGRFLAKAVLELFRMYCYSSKEAPDQAVDPLVEHMGPCRLSTFTQANRERVARMAEKLYAGMKDQSIAQITDDFYFKQFAQEKAANVISRYKIVLADEAQDHNEVTADILINSPVPTVFVGDSLQQVYAWRYAVNTLNSVPEYQQFLLTGAFRFGEGIARTVNRVIHNLTGESLGIRGLGGESQVEAYDGDQPPLRRGFAYLSRTNGDLLKLAESAISIDWSLYIEGGVKTLQFNMMYHILQLLEGGRPKHPFFALFEDIDELQEYCEAIDDRSTLALIGIVKKYKRGLFALETGIKRSQVQDKRKADVILTTAHKAKGLEFGNVALFDNFAREIINTESEIDLDDWRTREEINLLYVAMTRAEHRLLIPGAVAVATPVKIARRRANEDHDDLGDFADQADQQEEFVELDAPSIPGSLKPLMHTGNGYAIPFPLDIIDDEGDEVYHPKGLPSRVLRNGQVAVEYEGRVRPVWVDGGRFLAFASGGRSAQVNAVDYKGVSGHADLVREADPHPSPVYVNHCFGCHSDLYSDMARCSDCGWISCPNCGACGCDYGMS